MSHINITFKIFSTKQSSGYDRVDLIEGGLRIVIDSIVITKRENDVGDDGYRGDYIFNHFWSWLDSIPSLLNGQECTSQLLDNPGIFVFSPKGNVTFIKFCESDNPDGISRVIENGSEVLRTGEYFNRLYPNYPEGIPISTVSLIKEILRVAEDFYYHLEKNIPVPNDDLLQFRTILITRKKFFFDYLKSHSEMET
jgi:hypothetical protein